MPSVQFWGVDAAGEDQPQGTLTLTDAGFQLDPPDSELLRNILEVPIVAPRDGQWGQLTAADGADFLAGLPWHYREAYLHAALAEASAETAPRLDARGLAEALGHEPLQHVRDRTGREHDAGTGRFVSPPAGRRVKGTRNLSRRQAEKEKPPQGEQHSYASTQFDLDDAGYTRTDGSPLPRLTELADAIAEEDLAEDGREERFHITCFYGLEGSDPSEVRRVLKEWLAARKGGPTLYAELGHVSLFPAGEKDSPRGGKEYDVVKVGVHSAALHSLHKALAALPHKTTHPIYQPHITLAYVKPGQGAQYTGADFHGQTVLLHQLIFSDPEENETVLDLRELSQPDPSPEETADEGEAVPVVEES